MTTSQIGGHPWDQCCPHARADGDGAQTIIPGSPVLLAGFSTGQIRTRPVASSAATDQAAVSGLGSSSTPNPLEPAPSSTSCAETPEAGASVTGGAMLPVGQRQRRRSRRRELFCPLHPEERLYSVSPKHHLYLTDVGQLMVRGLSKRRAGELLRSYRQVLPLSNEWIEGFWCEACATTTWWHVTRQDRLLHSLAPVARELWEQASGVILAEGNPSVSQFSRRQARAIGVQGQRQYRFL